MPSGLEMGEFAGFVWSAYGLVFGALIWVAVQSWRESRRFQREAERLKARLRGENE